MKTKTLEKNQNEMFRQMLEQQFVERRMRNARYSIRSFAKSLRISSSALSAIISGKRPITPKMCLRLGSGLGLTVNQIMHLSDGELPHTTIELSRFAVISDWYHYAILELMRTKGFVQDHRLIAKRLGISSTEVMAAVSRLKDAGLLEINADGAWREVGNVSKTNIQNNMTSDGSRKLQRQILEKAIIAIEELSLEERNNTSITIAMNPVLIEEVTQRIKTFRRSLASFIETESEARGGSTEVFNLGIAFYPLTQPVVTKELQ